MGFLWDAWSLICEKTLCCVIPGSSWPLLSADLRLKCLCLIVLKAKRSHLWLRDICQLRPRACGPSASFVLNKRIFKDQQPDLHDNKTRMARTRNSGTERQIVCDLRADLRTSVWPPIAGASARKFWFNLHSDLHPLVGPFGQGLKGETWIEKILSWINTGN